MKKSLMAPEIIATTIGCSVEAVTDGRVKNRSPDLTSVYRVGGVYYCSPSSRKSPPAGYKWTRIGTEQGRDVFHGESGSASVAVADRTAGL
jgi:hypothetical protein